jgi:hypothetical protein
MIAPVCHRPQLEFPERWSLGCGLWEHPYIIQCIYFLSLHIPQPFLLTTLSLSLCLSLHSQSSQANFDFGHRFIRRSYLKEYASRRHKREQTTFDSPATLPNVDRALNQPRPCRSQHPACPRLNVIIGRFHVEPLYRPHPS